MNKLTIKIFLITCTLMILIAALTYGFIAWVMPLTYTASRSEALNTAAEQLALELETSTLTESDELLARYASIYDAQFSITTLNGEPVKIATLSENNGGTQWNFLEDSSFKEEMPENTHVMQAIGVSFAFADDPTTYQLIAVGNMKAVNQAAEALTDIWPWLMLVILLISSFTSLFYARFITRPIVSLSTISQRMCSLDFSWRCEEKRKDEIGLLAKNLNELAEKLSVSMTELKTANAKLQADIEHEQELERQRMAFFSAVSHELKTPITIIKGQLSGMLDGVGSYVDHDRYLARSLHVVHQMEALVSELLVLSRLENSECTPAMELVDLSKLVQSCMDSYSDLFEQKHQTLVFHAQKEMFVWGDHSLLSKCIRNLLSNAALYSPPEAHIFIRLFKQNQSLQLQIENTGVKLPDDALPHLFEAFYRVEKSRNRQNGGSGLGLYLVKKLLEYHHASCTIINSEQGVCVSVNFPLVEDEMRDLTTCLT